MILLSDANNGQTVEIPVGETLRVSLSENASTGYRWAVDRYNDDIVEMLDAEPHYISGAIGSGGEISVSFRARTEGDGEVALKHWKHWEGESSVIARFVIKVHVRTAQ